MTGFPGKYIRIYVSDVSFVPLTSSLDSSGFFLNVMSSLASAALVDGARNLQVPFNRYNSPYLSEKN